MKIRLLAIIGLVALAVLAWTIQSLSIPGSAASTAAGSRVRMAPPEGPSDPASDPDATPGLQAITWQSPSRFTAVAVMGPQTALSVAGDSFLSGTLVNGIDQPTLQIGVEATTAQLTLSTHSGQTSGSISQALPSDSRLIMRGQVSVADGIFWFADLTAADGSVLPVGLRVGETSIAAAAPASTPASSDF